jgi:hypothetical protein
MSKYQSFTEFLTTQSPPVEIVNFLINLILAAILSFVLNGVYIKYGSSLSNRTMFGRNFILLATTTMLIITIVKSSLALSLGLVGALSIVRFRAAIKEPEELSYLFLNIAIGLGFGADQRIVTVVAFLVIVGIIILQRFRRRTQENQNLYLTISCENNKEFGLEKIINILKKHCFSVTLKRFEDNQDALEALFLVDIEDFNKLNECKLELKSIGPISITFLDTEKV